MYPNHREIEKKLFCMNCNRRFDCPKVLPCSNTICLNCLNYLCKSNNLIYQDNQLKKSSFITNNSNFYCPFCAQMHIRPQEDFPTNGIVLEMLNHSSKVFHTQASSSSSASISPTFSDFTDSHYQQISAASIEMETVLIQLKSIVSELKSSVSKSEIKFKENCDNIRRKIIQNTTNVINEINTIRTSMLNEVDKYEKNLLICDLDPVKKESINLKELLDQTDNQINEWYKFLSINAKTRINETAIRNEILTAKVLEERLLNKSDMISNFFSEKEHIIFNDKNIKLNQSNFDLKSLIGTITYKTNLPQPIADVDTNNNLTKSLKASVPYDNDNCKFIDYSSVITDNLKNYKDILVALFKNTESNNQEEYVIGINQKSERQPNRHKTNFKLLNDKLVKLADSIHFDCLIIHMYVYKIYLVVLSNESDSFVLNLYDQKLKLLKKQTLNFKPSYFNVHENGIYLFIKQPEHQLSDSRLILFDWDLKEIVSIELNFVLKKNRFYLNITNDLYFIKDKIYLIDKLNSRIYILSCKNGELLNTMYYSSCNKIHTPQQAQQLIQPKFNGDKFLIQINSYENVIVVDSQEKNLVIIDSKSSNINLNTVYRKNLGFIQNINSFQLIDDYSYMIHDKANKMIHIINIS